MAMHDGHFGPSRSDGRCVALGTSRQSKGGCFASASAGEQHMGLNEHWSDFAACKGSRPDELFVRGAAQNRAKQVCGQCPVRTECLAEALDNNIEWGVWGGMTERERRALLRRRPNVTSWRRLLEAAREEHGTVAALLGAQAAG